MVNRFCDTEIWKKDWFLELSDKQKLLTKFLFDNCDCAGFYKISWHLLKCFFSEVPTKEDFEKIKQVKFISKDLIFIEDFALFQCKVKSFTDLNPKNKAHLGVLRLLEKYNIYQGALKPLDSPLKGVQEKEQEKEKEKKQEKELELSFKEDLFFDKNIQKVISLYKEHCKSLIPIKFEHRTRERLIEIKEFLKVVGLDFNYVIDLMDRANKQKVFYENKISLKSLIKNHAEIYSGLGASTVNQPQGSTNLTQKLNELAKKYSVNEV